MKTTFTRAGWAALALTWALALAACGGGSGGSGSSEPLPRGDSPDSSSNEPLQAPKNLVTTYQDGRLALQWDGATTATYELLQDPDGTTGPQPALVVAQTNSSTVSHELSLSDRLNPDLRFSVRACADGVCTTSTEAPALTPQSIVRPVKKYRAADNEQFAYEVALSSDGMTMAVGTWAEATVAHGVSTSLAGDGGALVSEPSGAVVIYTRSHPQGAWTQQAILKPETVLSEGTAFGESLSLSADGNTLAVGARLDSSGDNGISAGPSSSFALVSRQYSGAAYVFVRTEGTWSQQAYIKSAVPNRAEEFGAAVALTADGNQLAVGVPAALVLSSWSGAVHLFERQGTEWTASTVLAASNPGLYDRFGNSLAFTPDGTTLAVGAFAEDGTGTHVVAGTVTESDAGNAAPEAGAVYVFQRPAGGAWTQQAYLKASRMALSLNFGFTLSISTDGNTLAVGAPGDDRAASGAWDMTGTISGTHAGAAYVFTRQDGNWAESAYLKPTIPQADAWFGNRVALSGDGRLLVVAEPYENSAATGLNGNAADTSLAGSGAAWVFQSNGGAWSKLAYLKAPYQKQQLNYATSLALSRDGGTLAVGTPWDESADATDPSVLKPASGIVFTY